MLLEAQNISRTYVAGGQTYEALARLSVNVNPGDFLVISGPSGAGKSTLLNLLSGLDRSTAGTVHYQGKNLALMSEREIALLRNTSFGFIFQTPHLLVDRTIFENVALPFHYGSFGTPDEIQSRCSELLEYVGLGELATRYPNTLSGGEMQRVVFARALVRQPKIIFADEPTGNLDGENSRRIITLLQEQSQKGCAVTMVTHDTEVVKSGNRLIHLEKV